MYQTLEQVRANERVELSNDSLYSDILVTDFIEEAGAIIDSYIGYSLIESNVDEETLCIPTTYGEFLVNFNRRFINQINDLTIETEFGISVLTISGSGDMVGKIFLSKSEGFMKTIAGLCPQKMFDPANDNHYKAIVNYSAGFNSDNLPTDIKKAFYAILRQLKSSYDSSNSEDVQPVSNQVKRYSTLNETMEFVEDKTKDGTSDLLSSWVKEILNKYRKANQGIGIYM